MAVTALILSALALVLALVAMARSGGSSAGLEDVKRDARRRIEGLAEERDRQHKNLRMVVAALAGGQELTRKQVLEGVLWHDVDTPKGKQMLEDGARIIDVRSPEETGAGILPQAILIPVEEIEERWREIPDDGQKTLVYCAGGVRSAFACEFLTNAGYTNLYNLEGGFMSWNGPVTKP